MTTTENGGEYPEFVIDISAIALSDKDDEPTRIPIAMTGTFYKGKQKITITPKDIAQMSENLRLRGNGEVVLDYEHASEQPEVAAGGPVPAAGWIVGIDPTPDHDNVVWGFARLNEAARRMIEAKEYKYISPNIVWGKRDNNTGVLTGAMLTSAALTNKPVLNRMPAISLSDAGWTAELSTEGEKPLVPKEKVMCPDHPKTQLLCPQCDSDEISSLSASEHEHRAPKVISLSDVTRDGVGRLNISTFSAGEVCSIEVVRALDQQRVALSEVDAAIASGKIKPALKDQFTKIALSDIENFRSLVNEMPAQVDLSERGHGGEGPTGNASDLCRASVALSEATQAIVVRDKIPYASAFKRAQLENPDLVRRRNSLANRSQRITGEEE